jgi:hypothetical protein
MYILKVSSVWLYPDTSTMGESSHEHEEVAFVMQTDALVHPCDQRSSSLECGYRVKITYTRSQFSDYQLIEDEDDILDSGGRT